VLSFLGFGPAELFGIAIDYLLAAGLMAAGIYIVGFFTVSSASPFYRFLTPLKWVGGAIAALGLIIGSVTFGKSIAASDCIAAGRLAAVQQENASLKRDLKAQRAATKAKEDEAAKLAAQQRDADDQIASWQSYAATLSTAVAACRRATRDDDARLCKLLDNAAAGCRAAR
jgi:hypothetical protein